MHCPRTESTVERVPLPDYGVPGLAAWMVGNRVGECPMWDTGRQWLWWIDVRAPALLALDPARAQLLRWTLPEPVGAAALGTGGRIWLALAHRIAVLDTGSGRLATVCEAESERPHNRLNDGKPSPSGRWFVYGSMDDRPGDKQPTGALYCLDEGGTPRCLHDGLVVANGIAFADGGRVLVFSDSQRGTVWRAPWDEDAGTVGTPMPWLQLNDTTGRPDGATCDSIGRYWSAGVSAGCLNAFTVDGVHSDRIPLPCAAPTMPAFDGQGRLWITSLVRPQWAAPDRWQGALFETRAPVAGASAGRLHWRWVEA